MKLYIVTKTETSPEMGTLERLPKIFLSFNEAIKSVEQDVQFEVHICKKKMKLYVKTAQQDVYLYDYETKDMQPGTILYNIWQRNL